MDNCFVKVSSDEISTEELLEFVDSGENGAEVLFIGKVRAHNLGKKVVGVSYDAFEAFAVKIFKDICEEARKQFGESLRIGLVHRTGFLKVSEVSIAIAVGSPHRNEAYVASRYVIEQTKIRAAIWKKEHYEDGETKWLRGHALCQHGEGQAQAAPEPKWF